MPTTTKITKEMILDAAFDIVRKSGFEGLNNRTLAKKMNCSIRPIYYQFKNTEELNNELIRKIEKYFYNFLLKHKDNEIPVYKQIGLNYIMFATEEPKLFQILFMTESGLTPIDFLTSDDEDFKELAKCINLSTNLTDDDLKEFHIKMWIFTHGVATIVANKTFTLTEEQISQLLSYGFQAFMLLEEKEDKEEKNAKE